MIIRLGKNARIFFKTGSKLVNEFGLWLEASIQDHTNLFIPDEIRKIYQNRNFSDTIIIRDAQGNNFFLPQDEIESIEYI